MMSGDSGSWTKEMVYKSDIVPVLEERSLEKLDFEGLITKVGFYQR